jgi:hypothetical protein
MLSAYDRIRIAAHIVANPRTVLRVYQGAGSDYSYRRVAEGAKTLGLPPPPLRSSPPNSPEPSETGPSRPPRAPVEGRAEANSRACARSPRARSR